MNTVPDIIRAESQSVSAKIRNAMKVKLSPDAMEIYLNGNAKLCRAEQMATDGFKVKNPTYFIPPEKPLTKSAKEKAEEAFLRENEDI